MPWLPQLVTHGRDSQHSGVPRALLCIMGTQASGGDQPWQPVSTAHSSALCRAGQPMHVHGGDRFILGRGAVLYSVGCVTPSPAHPHSMPGASPEGHLVVTIKDVSRSCHVSLGGKIILWLRTTVLGPAAFFLLVPKIFLGTGEKISLIIMLGRVC